MGVKKLFINVIVIPRMTAIFKLQPPLEEMGGSKIVDISEIKKIGRNALGSL
jgi:hypothetical protein